MTSGRIIFWSIARSTLRSIWQTTFSVEELAFIGKHYRHSANFRVAHGLRAYNNEDCEEGVAIFRTFIQDSDED